MYILIVYVVLFHCLLLVPDHMAVLICFAASDRSSWILCAMYVRRRKRRRRRQRGENRGGENRTGEKKTREGRIGEGRKRPTEEEWVVNRSGDLPENAYHVVY